MTGTNWSNKGSILKKFILLSFFIIGINTVAMAQCPSADAGSDVIICIGSTFSPTDASVQNISSLLWVTAGDGTFAFETDPNPNQMIYTPGTADLAAGFIDLSLIAYRDNGPCQTPDTSIMRLTFTAPPIVNAGNDTSICTSETLILPNGHASASDYASLQWTHTGTGSIIANATNNLEPWYQPGPGETGLVFFTLTATADGSCTDETDEFILVINTEPSITNPDSQTGCDSYTLPVIAGSNLSGGQAYFTASGGVSGGGTQYNAGDIITSNMILFIYDENANNCSNEEFFNITITHSPLIYAGNDAIICSGQSFTVPDASATDHDGLSWSHNGTGAFNPLTANTLTPTYVPGFLETGTVTLTLTATGQGTCPDESDILTLTILDAPNITNPGPVSACASYTLPAINGTNLSPNRAYYTATGGGGVKYLENQSYSIAGTTTLFIYDDNGSCSDEESFQITINTPPIINNPGNQNVCNSYTLPPITGSNLSGNRAYWTNNNGTGTRYDPGDVITNTISLFIYDNNGTCSDEEQFDIVVIQTPVITSPGNQIACDSYTLPAINVVNPGGNASYFTAPARGGIQYNPGATITATTTLYINDFNGACEAEEQFEVTIVPQPVISANAGANVDICGLTPYTLDGSASTNYEPNSIIWTVVSGFGDFTTPTNILTPTYTPVASDIAAGSVILRMQVTGLAPCSNVVTDDVTLNYTGSPTVDAGNNEWICDGQNLAITTASSTYATVLWTSSGTGSFINDTDINPVYIPSANDYLQPSVTLTMTGTAIAPCTGTVQDQMTLFFENTPVINAGTLDTICSGSDYYILNSSGDPSTYSSILWTAVGGDGTWFNGDQNILHPTYIPGTNDLLLGYVDLQLTATPNAPCAANVTSQMRLTLISGSTANAGTDLSSCDVTPVPISLASASGYSSILWTSGGTGSFNDPTIENPIYTPSALDVSNGSVVLQLEAFPNNPCSSSATSSITLSLSQNPTVNAGIDNSICANGTYFISDATASNYSNLTWSVVGGDGTFAPSANDLNPVYTPGTNDILNGSALLRLTVQGDNACSAIAVIDELDINIDPLPAISMAATADVCEVDLYNTNPVVTNAASVSWSNNGGDGVFTASNQALTTYSPGTNDLNNGFVILTLTANGMGDCVGASTSANIQLNFVNEPDIDAGPDVEICEDGFTISNASGDPTTYATLLWTSSGDVGTITNQTSLTPTYSPSALDIANGFVFLRMTATPIGPCATSVIDSFRVDINEAPVVDAGPDETICEGIDYIIPSANASNYPVNGLQWSTPDGNGTFLNDNDLNATYQPDPSDIIQGSVRLVLTAQANAPCSTASDELILNFQALPTVDLGSSTVTICETDTYTANPTVNNEISVSWTHDGSGSFDNTSQADATYTPSAADIAGGSVTLRLTATGIAPCATNAFDEVELIIEKDPIADAGPASVTICENDTYQTSSATAPNATSYLWQVIGGSGTINNFTTLNNALYTPSQADINNGSVTLRLTATNGSPCNGSDTDDLIIYFTLEPQITSTPTPTLCEGISYFVNIADTINAGTVLWTLTSGSGVLSNATNINPSYTPNATDAANGNIILTLEAFAINPCTNSASESFTFTIAGAPTVNVGSDTTVCEGTPYIALAPTITNGINYQWTSPTGNGTFIPSSMVANPRYYPDATDYAAGSISLQLEVTGDASCSSTATDALTVTFTDAPTAFVNPTAFVCVTSSYYVSSGFATNYASISWIHDGNGLLLNANSDKPTYHPDPLDAGNNVTLTMTVNGNGDCSPAVDQMVLTVLREPEVIAFTADEAYTCGSSFKVNDASAQYHSGILWTTSPGADGSFDDPTRIDPTYTLGTNDISNGGVALILTASAIAPCSDDKSDSFILNVIDAPTANAGSDASICETQDYITSTASATANSVEWSILLGTGSFDDPTNLSCTYYPSANDITVGSVTLRLTAYGDAACPDATDDITISIVKNPNAYAGDPDDVCLGTTYQVNDATVQNTGVFVWTTNGYGTLTNADQINPFYEPHINDINLLGGKVDLTLTAPPLSPCAGNAVSVKTLTIIQDPTAFAGINDTVCIGTDYVISNATASDSSSLFWSSSTGGVFSNNGTITPTYHVNSVDEAQGWVDITLTANPITPCANIVQHTFRLTVLAGPTAFAGANTTICANGVYTNTDATATDYTSLLWETSGDGVFTNNTVLQPVYTPGNADTLNGSVTLTLKVFGSGSNGCNQAESSVNILINKLPTADAGPMTEICEGSTLIQGASATNYSQLLWTILNGTGNLQNASSLTPLYNTSAGDIGTTVILQLAAIPLTPCTDTAFSTLSLAVIEAPTVDAGGNATVCRQTPYALSAATTNNLSNDFEWMSSGSGTWSNKYALNPTYFPSAGDVLLGSVTLTITASSSSCNDAIDFMILTLESTRVDVVSNASVCENSTYTPNATIVGNYGTISWTTSGAGSFIGSTNTTTPIYDASADVGNTVTLTISVDEVAPCAGFVQSALSLEVKNTPIASVGNDTTICEDEIYQVVGAATSYASNIYWTTSGDGVFSGGGLTPTYYPGTNDLSQGYVDLTIHGENPPCQEATDQMRLSFSRLPIVDAGLNATVDIGASFTISTASVSDPTALLNWTSSSGASGGTFTGGTTLTPTYTPSAFDFANGSVQLILTATPTTGICTTPVPDYMLLTVTDHPPVDFYWNTSCVDAPMQFLIDTTVTDTTAIVSYSWDYGDGNTSTGALNKYPFHTYNTAGTYTVTLTVVDTAGYTNIVWHYVDVNPIPVVNFSYDQPSCSDLITQFNDHSVAPSGYITEWIWDFDDGTPPVIVNYPDDPNVQHTFPNSGTNPATSMTFLVNLTVTTSDGCTNAATLPVTVLPSPIADFTFENQCVNNSTIFIVDDATVENGGGSIVSYIWDFGDLASGTNNISNIQNPIHVFNTAGTYDVTLTVENVNGCTDTYTETVIINVPPPVAFTSSPACLDAPTTFEVDEIITNVANVTNWYWDFGDGQTYDGPIQNQVHTYSLGGTYTVTLTITDIFSCTNSYSLDVFIYPPPVANFTNVQPSCGDTITYFNDYSVPQVGYITEWIWDFGDGSVPDTVTFPESPNVEHTYTQVGYTTSYDVSLTVTTSYGCVDEIIKEVEILASPIALFRYEEACAGSLTSFMDASIENSGGSIVNWYWDFGDPTTGINNTTTVQNPTHVFSGNDADSIYIVSLTITSSTGCINTYTDSVVVISPPIVDFDFSPSCLDSSVVFIVDQVLIPDIADVSSWFWEFGDGTTSTDQNAEHTYSASGIYTVNLTILNNNGCSNTVSHDVEVYELPTANFDFSDPTCNGNAVQFTDYSNTPSGTTITEWKWYFGDGNSIILTPTDDPNTEHIYDTTGIITASLVITNSNGCVDSISKQITLLPSPIADFEYSAACLGELTLFTDLSNANGSTDITAWNWDFGDPTTTVNNTSTAQNPVHEFSGAGDFTVQLQIENSQGCTDTIDYLVTVTDLPTVDFTTVDSCLGTAVEFTVDQTITNIGSIATYSWEFGDGITETGQTPSATHEYLVEGTYTAILTVTDTSGCSNSVSHEVILAPLPLSLFGMSESQCSSDSIEFTNYSTSEAGYITRWDWDFGDGNVTTIDFPDNPSLFHQYELDGTYTVTLTVTNSLGCSNFSTQEITILPGPIPNFEAESVCLGVNAEFTDLSQSNGGGQIVSWNWEFGDPASGINNSSTIQNPVHQFSSAGTYTVLLQIENARGCIDTISRVLTVNELPDIDFEMTDACINGEVIFTPISTIDELFYFWEFGDGLSSSDPNPTHHYEIDGSYIVTLTVTDTAGCTNSVSHDLDLAALPQALFGMSESQCISDPIEFTNYSTTEAGYITQWDWDFGDGDIRTVYFPDNPNSIHLYESEGTYEVTLTVLTSMGCSNFSTQEITVRPAPVANFTATTVCIDHPAEFTDLSQENGAGVIVDWYWDFGDPESGINNHSTRQNPIHQYAVSDTFLVSLTITNAEGCVSTYTDSSVIVTLPPPLDPFTFSNIICMETEAEFFMSNSVNIEDVQTILWDFGDPLSGDNNYSSEQNPVHLYENPGEYTVTLTLDNDNCGGSIDTTIIVNPRPQARFEFENACIGNPTVFTDLSLYSDSPIVDWKWDFGIENLLSDTSGLQNPIYTYRALGEHLVSLEVTDEVGCSDMLDSVLIKIFPTPTANFSFVEGEMGTIEFTNESQDATSYEWNFGDGWISDETDPVHQYDTANSLISATYEGLQLMLISMDTSGCADTAIEVYDLYFKGLFIPTAFSPNNPSEAVRIFKPIGVNLQSFEIEVYSSWGDMIWQSSAIDENGRPTEYWDGTLNGSELPTGAYVWKANAVFKDGSIWKGNPTTGGTPTTSGTVILIR